VALFLSEPRHPRQVAATASGKSARGVARQLISTRNHPPATGPLLWLASFNPRKEMLMQVKSKNNHCAQGLLSAAQVAPEAQGLILRSTDKQYRNLPTHIHSQLRVPAQASQSADTRPPPCRDVTTGNCRDEFHTRVYRTTSERWRYRKRRRDR
jgi:hypothetical protein